MQSLRNHFRSVYRNSVREFLRSNRCSLNQWDATYIIYQLIPKNNHKRLDLTALPAQPVPPGFQASRRHLSYMPKLWIIMKENMLHPIQAEKVEVPGMAWHLCLCVLMSRYQFDVANLTNLTFFSFFLFKRMSSLHRIFKLWGSLCMKDSWTADIPMSMMPIFKIILNIRTHKYRGFFTGSLDEGCAMTRLFCCLLLLKGTKENHSESCSTNLLE